MSLRTRPTGPKWYYECRFCHEEIETNEVQGGQCPHCRLFGSIVRLPQGKPGKHIPPGFAKGEQFDETD